MKILIVSDTHKAHRNLETALDRTGKIDMLIHLGDVEGYEDYIEALADCPAHILAGNNDYFSYLPREEEFYIKDHRVFITHGHYYYVGQGEEHLLREARARGVEYVMYGHTHRPSLKTKDGVTILNPGSISYPRQMGRKASYMVREIDSSGEVKITLEYIE